MKIRVANHNKPTTKHPFSNSHNHSTHTSTTVPYHTLSLQLERLTVLYITAFRISLIHIFIPSRLLVIVSNMAELLLLIICAAFIVLLFITFIGTLTLPFLNASKKNVQDLFLAAKDLTQPMGSFSSTILYPPAPIVGNHPSDSTALPLSPEQMPAEGGSQSNATRGVAEPTRGESESKPTTTRPPNGLPPIHAGFNTTTSPTPTKPVPDNQMSSGSEGSAEEHFFDSLEYRQASDDDTQLAGLIAEVQLPEQPGAETDSVGSIPTVADKDEEEQQEKASTAAVEEALNKAQVFEKAIQGLVDPEGGDGPDHQRMIELVTGIVEGQAEAVEKLRSETVRFHRAEDDLRHGWQDMKEVFERIVKGQNVRLRSTQEEKDELVKENDEILKENDEIVKENDELVKENETFIEENAALKEDFDSMKIQQENDLRSLENEKQTAQEDADTLKAEVEGRIDAMKDRYEKEKSAAKDKNWQEQNALICARKMVADNLFEARRQVTQGQQQHQATVKTKDNTIKELEMMISRLRTTAMASTELAASAERVSDKQLNDQRNESSALRDQLRESKDEIRTLVEWKEKAEFAERKYQRLSDLRKDEKTTLKADHAHVVARLELDKKGLDRTITINEGVIADLERRITGMESGQEFKDIKSKLLRVQKQNQKSTSDVKTLKEQLQALELETGVQKRNIEKKDLEIQQNTQAWATEKTTLEDQLKQDKDALGHEMQEQVGRLKNEKEGLLRNVAAAQSAEQGVLAQVQTLEKEKAQTAEQHQRTLSAKDQRIQELEREIGGKAQTAEQHQRTLSAKDQRIQELEHEIGEKNAAGSAIEEQKNIMEAALNRERGTHEEATNRAKETETTLQTEISALRSQAEAYTNAPEPMSTTATDSERADNRKELTFLATEVNEAFYLSEEIGEHGLVRDSGECALLKDLNSAKKAQAFLEFDVKQPDFEKNELLFTIAEAIIDEGRFSQCDSRKRPELVKQARAANERMQRIQKMLSTNLDVQKDAVLEILRSPAKNETNNRQEEGESNMADISEMQNAIIPEASETGQPSRTIADILATLQNCT